MDQQPPPAQGDLLTEPTFGWDLGTLFGVIRRRAWVVVLCAVAAVALGIGYLAVTPPVYEAKTVMQAEQQEPAIVTIANALREDLTTVDVMKTIEQNLASTALLLRVAKAAKLDQDLRFTGERKSLLTMVTDLFKKSESGTPTDQSLIRTMSDRTKIALRRGTRLIDVTVRAQDPGLARELSQSIVTEYTRLNFEQKLEASKPAYDYLVNEAERLKKKLEESEQKLQAYREDKRAVSLEQTQNIVVETLKDLNKSLSEARGHRISIESDVASIESLKARPAELLALPGIAATAEVLALKQRIADQEAGLASLAERFDSKHPTYRQAQSEVEKLRLSLAKAAQDAAGLVRASFAAAKETEEKTLAALQEQEQRALNLNKIAIQYNVLTRDVESDRTLYEAVLKQIKETQVIQGAEKSAVRIVEPAILPDRVAWPKKSIVLAIALALGLTAGTGMALGPVLLRAPLLTPGRAEARLNLPALAMIPHASTRPGPHKLFLLDHPNTPAAEEIRTLRAALCGGRPKEGRSRSFLFTSALSGEGTTFCALNFAAALALDGRRTLLIDTNLRSPEIGRTLFGKQPAKGLTDILSGELGLSTVVQASKLENLSILTAGTPTNKPSEILGSAAMADLLANALAAFDCLVLDSPPVLEVSDALRLAARWAGSVCMVVHASRTPESAVLRALHLLTIAGDKPPVGFVLNQTPSSPASL